MSHRHRRTVAVLATLLAAALMIVPSSSSAETVPGLEMGWDTTGDVVVESFEPGATVGTPAVVAQDRVIGDIYRYRISHETKVVRVSLKYRALPAAGRYNLHEVYIGTGRTSLAVEVLAGPGHWLGTRTVRRAGVKVDCPHLVARIDYVHRMFLVQVPRTCLGNPHWVRVDGIMYSHVGRPGGGYLNYADFAFTKGFVDGSDLSPRVYEPTVQNTSGPSGLQ